MAAERHAAIGAAMAWWSRLRQEEGSASSARLRHCGSVFDALLQPETQDLIRAVRSAGGDLLAGDIDHRLAVLAISLVHVETASHVPLAEALGRTADGLKPTPNGNDRQRLSPIRFGSLLRYAHAQDWDGFVRSLRRALAIVRNPSFSVPAFVADMLFFGDRVLERWTYQYWQTSGPEELQLDTATPISSPVTEETP